jgi:ionotropic glutamate receptor
MDAIREDFKKTGKCRLQLARDGFSNALVSFALPKNSKFTKTISKGCVKLTKNHFKMKLIGYLHAVDISINRMLELMQTGIIDHWDLWSHPMPR